MPIRPRYMARHLLERDHRHDLSLTAETEDDIMKVKDCVALVTGGANGIGEACAREMAKAGAKVVICDMDQPGIDRVMTEIRSEGGDAVGVRGNVVAEEDQARFVKCAVNSC